MAAVTDLAYRKSVRSNRNRLSAQYVVDGNKDTYWTGDFYPSYVDIDLQAEYCLQQVTVCVPEGKSILFSLYGSTDGKNYRRLYQLRKLQQQGGEYPVMLPQKPVCRILRVYVEYTEGDDRAYLSNVRVYGTKHRDSRLDRSGTFEEILRLEPFESSEYAAAITQAETVENVYGIIDRTVGSRYRDWFSFEITGEEAEFDSFELSDRDGKICITGNIGLSLAMGLNYYYKHYLHVHVSEQTVQGHMPQRPVPVGKPVRKQTNSRLRYAFNYCTLCYTFAFFGPEDWQRENDWLALNGVNLVMDLAGQEATWIKFLMQQGYSFDEAKDWLTGPAYYAWQFMDNMEAFGGPLHDDYVADRVRLARASQRFRSSLGMHTLLQGYAGMVPTDFGHFAPHIKTIEQGTWNGFARPIMVATDTQEYADLAESFYEAQRFVYGDKAKYFAVDPFHEGGIRPQGLDDSRIAEGVLNAMLKYNKDAVWVIQGWQSNPTNALLRGMGEYKRDHALVIDLIKYPITPNTKYDRTSYGSTTLDAPEFCGTDWVWGLLGGFGGNPTMNGQLQVMTDSILSALKSSRHMCGIGIISEGQFDNPVKYDLIFELCLAGEDFDLDEWLRAYQHRRYGAVSQNAGRAWQIMKNTNYDHGVRYTTEVYAAKNRTPADYGRQSIGYDAQQLVAALRYLLRDFADLQTSAGYRYDLSELMRQVVSNCSVLLYNDLLSAAEAQDVERFRLLKQRFLQSLQVLNDVSSTQKEQLAGEWIGKACDLAGAYDDFTRDAFVLNAKTLITTWGSRASCRLLKDYGWRNYEGMFLDVYAAVWTQYLDEREAALAAGEQVPGKSVDDYFAIYWQWVLGSQEHLRTPRDTPEELYKVAQEVLDLCTLVGDADAAAAGDIALGRQVQCDACVGTPGCITAGNDECLQLPMGEAAIVDLVAEFELGSVFVTLGQRGSVRLYSSADKEHWELLDAEAVFEPGKTAVDARNKTARFIKLEAGSDGLTLRQVQVLGSRLLPSPGQMERLVAAAQELAGRETAGVLSEARAALAANAAPDALSALYWRLYDALCASGA